MTHFQHHLPLDSSSLTKWRKRLKTEDLEALLSTRIETWKNFLQHQAIVARGTR
jgi:hypothetical protein